MIRGAVHQWLAARSKAWAHDRSATIGASEIGQCARRVWFAKNALPSDPGYTNQGGAAARGDLIEQYVWLPAVLACLPPGATLHCAGEQQRTLTHGYLSATPDGIVTGLPPAHLAHHGIADASGAVLLECKSIDPRVDLREAKAEHRAQVQVQLGIVRAATAWQPTHALISYIDASFLDQVDEFAVEFDPQQFANAERRALAIMDAERALDVRPEGKMAGGGECRHCPYASRCGDEQVAGVPKADAPLADNAARSVAELARKALAAAEAGKGAKADEAAAKEAIKDILRAHGTRRATADGVSVAWSTVKGRHSLDLEAAKAGGFDPLPWMKAGEPSERLAIKLAD